MGTVTDPAAESTGRVHAPPRDRRNPPLGDMVRSVVVLVALLSVVVLYQRFYSSGAPDYTPPVDVAPSLAQARDAAPFDVLAPVGLPAGWTATSVRYTPDASPRWHIGYLTPAGEYVGLEQEDVPVDELVQDAAAGTSPAGEVEVNGTTWQLRTDEDRSETTLVRADGDGAVLVTGSASQAELEQLAGALRGG